MQGFWVLPSGRRFYICWWGKLHTITWFLLFQCLLKELKICICTGRIFCGDPKNLQIGEEMSDKHSTPRTNNFIKNGTTYTFIKVAYVVECQGARCMLPKFKQAVRAPFIAGVNDLVMNCFRSWILHVILLCWGSWRIQYSWEGSFRNEIRNAQPRKSRCFFQTTVSKAPFDCPFLRDATKNAIIYYHECISWRHKSKNRMAEIRKENWNPAVCFTVSLAIDSKHPIFNLCLASPTGGRQRHDFFCVTIIPNDGQDRARKQQKVNVNIHPFVARGQSFRRNLSRSLVAWPAPAAALHSLRLYNGLQRGRWMDIR